MVTLMLTCVPSKSKFRNFKFKQSVVSITADSETCLLLGFPSQSYSSYYPKTHEQA